MFEGLPRLQPMTPQPQDWEKPASVNEEPISRADHTVLDSFLSSVNGTVLTLNTSDDVANREENRDALARSLEHLAKLPLKEADGLVRALFCQAHPTEEKRRTLDPGMLRVATSLFNDPDCAQHLSSFTKLGVDAQKRELLKMAAELETNPSPTPEAQRMFSLSMLAHVRTLPPETTQGQGSLPPRYRKARRRDAERVAARRALRRFDVERAFAARIPGVLGRDLRPPGPVAPYQGLVARFQGAGGGYGGGALPREIHSPDGSAHGQHLGADRPESSNRRLYRSSLVLCRLPGYGLSVRDGFADQGEFDGRQTFAVQGRSEREKDDGQAARDGQ